MSIISKILNKKTHSKGKSAELKAKKYLQKNDLALVSQNYRCKGGEIDLIMKDGSTLVFIEVRYRRKNEYGSSEESVDIHKQRRIIHAATHYLHTHPSMQSCACRFDVIALCQDSQNTARLQFNWIKHAFDAF